MWQFATGMFLIALQPESLRLTATYTFASGGAVLLLGPIVGDWVDRYPRITGKCNRVKVVRTAIVVQNLSVALSALAVCLTLTFQSDVEVIWGGWMMTLCQGVIILFGVIGDVTSIGRTIAVERDWIVVICNDKHSLTSMSALLRRIDLTTKLVAPVLTGQIITYGSLIIGALFISIWNLISMVFEYNLLLKLYTSFPELALKNTDGKQNDHDRKRCPLFFDNFLTVARGWKTYWAQPILLAGLALATTYMTVLGFDNITAAFAKAQGLSEAIVGLLQSIGALFGVLGTIIFPVLRKRLGLTRTGMCSFFLLLVSLVPCLVSIWAPGSPFDPSFLSRRGEINDGINYTLTDFADESVFSYELSEESYTIANNTAQQSYLSVGLLMGGIVIARTGLWMSDLSVTQLLLETPENSVRGIVNGVQNSLNQFEDLLKSLLVIVLPWRQTFGYLVFTSFAFISFANVLFACFSRRAGRTIGIGR
ncbi:hypothetical protein CAPTEDRAFT_5305 [Capitella teleta]|uniref:Solute carrier family 40 member n=1 Tax=Capitella teleta TaxID=283909 RepID=N1PB63_CAPTE|nr:hypothetical protein CAPTEDRAFT_5305 [Capitella teleta]|eukprot:ELU18806.1 hypothetical protein CAPTEDRAFT_5305 [Capitella teleta]